MMKTRNGVAPFILAVAIACYSSDAYQFTPLKMSDVSVTVSPNGSRRSFISSAAASVAAAFVVTPTSTHAAPQIFTTNKGVKYAITKDLPKDAKKISPQPGDIVAIEYTGYLTSGQIFDSTHAEGKNNVLLFKLGNEGAVIDGLQDMVANMYVGQKVQAIVPPQLAFGDKGICLEDKPDECLIKPGSTLVYDIDLKKSTIPPP